MMSSPLVEIVAALPLFALVLFRLSGLVLSAPVFGSRVVPMRIRAALVFVLAWAAFPIVKGHVAGPATLATVMAGAAGEVFIGLAVGLTLSLFLMAAEVAGNVAGQQAGLALSHVVDPTQGDQSSVLGQVYVVLFTFVFLIVGGHRAAVAAVLDSYRVVPLMTGADKESLLLLCVEVLTAAFILGIRLAGPVLIALFLTGTAMGFLSRTMPQLNILTVGFTVRTFCVLATAGLALNGTQHLLVDSIWDLFVHVRSALGVDADQTRLGS